MDRSTATSHLNELLVVIFNSILKIEEQAIKGSFQSNLSMTEIHTLVAIDIGDGKSMSEVANQLMISVSTLTIAIDKLLKKGFVERYGIQGDRRIVMVKLTEKGENSVAEHKKFHDKMIHDTISQLEEHELNVLIQSIENLNHFFSKQIKS